MQVSDDSFQVESTFLCLRLRQHCQFLTFDFLTRKKLSRRNY